MSNQITNPYIVKLASENVPMDNNAIRVLNLIAQAELDAGKDEGLPQSSAVFFDKAASVTDEEAALYKDAYNEVRVKIASLKIQAQGEADALFQEGLGEQMNIIDKTAGYTSEQQQVYAHGFNTTMNQIDVQKKAGFEGMKNAFIQNLFSLSFDNKLKEKCASFEVMCQETRNNSNQSII